MAGLDDSDVSAVLRRLVARTRDGRLRWTRINVGDQMTADSPDFFYYVGSRDADGAAPFIFEVWKELDTESVALVDVRTRVDAPFNDDLRRLFDAARASWLNITNLKDDIMRSLE